MKIKHEVKRRIKMDKLERIAAEYFATMLDLESAKALDEKTQIEHLEARLTALEINYSAIENFDIDKINKEV